MNQRESAVRIIEYFRERSEGIAAVMDDLKLKQAVKSLEKRADRLRVKAEQRVAVVEVDPHAATVLGRSVIIQHFRGHHCGGCFGEKPTRNAVCQTCYYRLPAPNRKALHLPFGEGFEQAYEMALRELGRDPEELTNA